MALFGRRGRAESRALTRQTVPSVFLPEPGTAAISPYTATRIGDVYACVRVLADSAASLPLIAYRRTASGRSRAGGRAQELIDQPAPATTSAGFVGQLVVHLNLWGNAYVGKYRDADGRVAQLGLLAPDTVEVSLENGTVLYTVYGREGVSYHGSDDVLHIRAALSEDGLLGLSPIRQGAGVIALSTALHGHALATTLVPHLFARRDWRNG